MCIDLHTHILPFLDDGSSSMDESLRMAEQAVKEGIHTIIATPHHLTHRYYNHSREVKQAVQELNSNFMQSNISLKVLPGQEVRMNNSFFKEWEEGSVLTLNHSRYLLIEFEEDVTYEQMQEWIHEIQMLQLVPIIAHPERIPAIIKEPHRIEELIQLGVLCQVTCLTIVGYFGRKVQKTAEKLCRLRQVHLLSSDAHDSIKRVYNWQNALDRLRKWAGDDWSQYVLQNANKVVLDQIIDVPTNERKHKERRNSFFSRYLR